MFNNRHVLLCFSDSITCPDLPYHIYDRALLSKLPWFNDSRSNSDLVPYSFETGSMGAIPALGEPETHLHRSRFENIRGPGLCYATPPMIVYLNFTEARGLQLLPISANDLEGLKRFKTYIWVS